MGIFERFLTVWVALGIAAGVALGLIMPAAFESIAALEYAQVNLVVAVFIWVMIYPMMIQIDWAAVKDVRKKPQGLMLTLVVNWLIKPFTMAALGVLFFEYLFAPWVDPASASEYIAGMILLGVAPCTAMVFVWSQLVKVNRPGFCRQSRASYFLSNRSQYEQSTLPRRIQDRGGQTNP